MRIAAGNLRQSSFYVQIYAGKRLLRQYRSCRERAGKLPAVHRMFTYSTASFHKNVLQWHGQESGGTVNTSRCGFCYP